MGVVGGKRVCASEGDEEGRERASETEEERLKDGTLPCKSCEFLLVISNCELVLECGSHNGIMNLLEAQICREIWGGGGRMREEKNPWKKNNARKC